MIDLVRFKKKKRHLPLLLVSVQFGLLLIALDPKDLIEDRA